MEIRVINQKLESLRRCVQRIEEKHPIEPSALVTNFDIQDIISVNIERAVQQCVDIAAHIAADFDDVAGQSAASLFDDLAAKRFISTDVASRLGKAAGFRNLLVHRYASINWERVHSYIDKDLGVFREFAAAIVQATGAKG
jgi:uncharacterized protein YutE (UPF0331/DUF86 family)